MPLVLWVLASAALGVVVLSGVALWFDRLFEEPGVRIVPSLVGGTGAGSVLAVFAHPDDETLACGALAEASGREGVQVRTITLTRGEQGYAPPPICREADLGVVRESELRRYGYLLGIDEQELWDYPDGSLAELPRGPIVDRIVATIRRHAPDLVIGFDPAGGYTGHPDHKAAGSLMTEAVRSASDPSYEPDLGPPHRPKTLAYIVAPRRMLRTFGNATMKAVAEAQPTPDVAMPASRRLKGMGWRVHQSQHLGKAYGLPAWLLYDFFDKEHYALHSPASLASDRRE